MPDQAGLTLNKEQVVTYSRSERSYLISKRDWDRLSRTIQRLKPNSHIWSNASWGFLGIGLSSMGSWFTDRHLSFFLIIGVVSIAVAIVSFFAAKYESMRFDTSVDSLKEVAADIEEAIVLRPDESE